VSGPSSKTLLQALCLEQKTETTTQDPVFWYPGLNNWACAALHEIKKIMSNLGAA
jgi:hypothetical protein